MSGGLGRLRAGRKVLAILAIAAGLGLAAGFLPDNSYQRWQLVDHTVDHDARWIYERTTFDPAPVDVAFVGNSRIAEGVDAPRLAAALKARGLAANVVNFALPQEGRNLQYLVTRQLLAHKRPKLLIVSVEEGLYRWSHPAFKYLADADLVRAPGPWTPNYLADAMYLPYRQLLLLTASVLPREAGLDPGFDPRRYGGSSLETGGRKVLDDGSVMVREQPASPADQARCLKAFYNGRRGALLPHQYARLDYAAEYHYVRLIADLAARRGVKLVFLAAPYYTGPATVADEPYFKSLAPIWNAGFLAGQGRLYADCHHLDGEGARRLTDWLISPVADALADPRRS